MKFYYERGEKGFEGCEPTMKFIKKINELGDAMNSRLPHEALRYDKDSKHYKVKNKQIQLSYYK